MVLLAQTSKGLFDVLNQELIDLGFKTSKSQDGIYFESQNLNSDCYLANLYLRSATRILLKLKSAEIKNYDQLYDLVSEIDFSTYIDVSQTIKVEADTVGSTFKDSRFVALKSKDAICDRFRSDFDKRPDVDRENPDLIIYIKVYHNNITVFINTSGATLSKRGYRKATVKAPLREHLASGLLLLTDWDKNSKLVDPMCGSGTILIEACLMALNSPPGLLRPSFSFQKYKTFDKDLWSKLLEQAEGKEKSNLNFKFYGYDISKKAIEVAKINAKKAGVSEFIEFDARPVDDLEKIENATVVTNPPYGERLKGNLKDDYKDLSYALKHKMKGATAWVLSSDPELTRELNLKASLKFKLLNGGIPCTFLKYNIL